MRLWVFGGIDLDENEGCGESVQKIAYLDRVKNRVVDKKPPQPRDKKRSVFRF